MYFMYFSLCSAAISDGLTIICALKCYKCNIYDMISDLVTPVKEPFLSRHTNLVACRGDHQK